MYELPASISEARAEVTVRPATPADAAAVVAILQEAAAWLRQRGIPLWREEEIPADGIAADVTAGLYVIAAVEGEPAGTMRFQLSDPEIWPELVGEDSAFVHRLAVRRPFAGQGVSIALLTGAAERTRTLGRVWLRLDCEAHRPKLRDFYESHGFAYHSDFKHRDYPTVARYEMRLDG